MVGNLLITFTLLLGFIGTPTSIAVDGNKKTNAFLPPLMFPGYIAPGIPYQPTYPIPPGYFNQIPLVPKPGSFYDPAAIPPTVSNVGFGYPNSEVRNIGLGTPILSNPNVEGSDAALAKNVQAEAESSVKESTALTEKLSKKEEIIPLVTKSQTVWKTVTLPNGMTMKVPVDDVEVKESTIANVGGAEGGNAVATSSKGSLNNLGRADDAITRARLLQLEQQAAAEYSRTQMLAVAKDAQVGQLRSEIEQREQLLARLSNQAHEQHSLAQEMARRRVAAEVDASRVGTEMALQQLLGRFKSVQNEEQRLQLAMVRDDSVKRDLMEQLIALRKSVAQKKDLVQRLLSGGSESEKAAQSKRDAAQAMEKKAMDLVSKARDAQLEADAAASEASINFAKEIGSDNYSGSESESESEGAGSGSGSGS
jgi:hypothetical protein